MINNDAGPTGFVMEDFSMARRQMVDTQIRTTDVTDYRVLAAMGEVPREAFVNAALRPIAYADCDLLVREPDDQFIARYILEPSPFAKLLQLADIHETDVVLDIGCATGYSSAVLASLAASIVALEEVESLASAAQENLMELGIDNVAVVQGPLNDGYASEAPYDLIFINGAVETIPAIILNQLKDGGRLVTVVGTDRSGEATLFRKSANHVSSVADFNTHIPAVPGFAIPPVFSFL